MVEPHPGRLLRLPEVLSMTGIGSKTDLYRRIRNGAFPASRRLSHRVAIWSESEVSEWIGQAWQKANKP
ncbi:helix-turn-helix transcriptional regulator [Brevundimonas aurantiaca]|uniref:helix-turn-helix transcriptional regulator n=1 Tax=Brevundimonas aurantiaca TaxID=74316 RepID=UPI003AFA282E